MEFLLELTKFDAQGTKICEYKNSNEDGNKVGKCRVKNLFSGNKVGKCKVKNCFSQQGTILQSILLQIPRQPGAWWACWEAEW